MVIISIDFVKQTYVPASFPSSFFFFYNGKNPKNFRLHLCQHWANSVIFSFLKNAPNVPHLSLSLVHAAFCFAKMHNNIVNCVYSNYMTIPHKYSTHFMPN